VVQLIPRGIDRQLCIAQLSMKCPRVRRSPFFTVGMHKPVSQCQTGCGQYRNSDRSCCCNEAGGLEHTACFRWTSSTTQKSHGCSVRFYCNGSLGVMLRAAASTSVSGQSFCFLKRAASPEHRNSNVNQRQATHAVRQASRNRLITFDFTTANDCCDENTNQDQQLDANLHVIDTGTIVTCCHLSDPYQQKTGDQLDPGPQVLPIAHRRGSE